jgi:hypothetical protein
VALSKAETRVENDMCVYSGARRKKSPEEVAEEVSEEVAKEESEEVEALLRLWMSSAITKKIWWSITMSNECPLCGSEAPDGAKSRAAAASARCARI